jgi:hypothetical protein
VNKERYTIALVFASDLGMRNPEASLLLMDWARSVPWRRKRGYSGITESAGGFIVMWPLLRPHGEEGGSEFAALAARSSKPSESPDWGTASVAGLREGPVIVALLTLQSKQYETVLGRGFSIRHDGTQNERSGRHLSRRQTSKKISI